MVQLYGKMIAEMCTRIHPVIGRQLESARHIYVRALDTMMEKTKDVHGSLLPAGITNGTLGGLGLLKRGLMISLMFVWQVLPSLPLRTKPQGFLSGGWDTAQ